MLGHGILYEHVDGPNFGFSHSAGDGLSGIYFDPHSNCKGVDGTPGRMDAVRLIAWRPGLHYRWHFGLFTEGGKNILATYRWTHFVTLAHVHARRPAERQERDREWEDHLVPYERELGAYD